MFVQIDTTDKNSVSEINAKAITEIRGSPVGHWLGSEQFIDHLFISDNISSLEEVTPMLDRLGIRAGNIREDHYIDQVGVAHSIYKLMGEDKVVLNEPNITLRIIELLSMIEEFGIDYIGWRVSDNLASGYTASDLSDNYTPD